jgi:predicted Zn-dependent protease
VRLERAKPQWILVFCALLCSCVRNPATGKRQLNFVSRDQEVAMGQQGAEDVRGSIGLYDATALSQYVERVGKRLAAVSERKDLPWSFEVVDDASVNAFALPGGFLFITRGLLAHLENEAQLASVLGHEIGHVTAQHSVNQISKAQLAQAGLGLGLGLGAALSETVAALGGLGAQGLQLLFLKFSRDDERQADDLGLRYALKAGYDVREMPKVFALLGRVSADAGGGRLPGWLATHPEPEERVQRSEKKIAELETDLKDLKRDEPGLMQAIDGMVFGDNPREGFFKDGHFYHPELAFSLTLPPGFQGINTKRAVGASNADGNAVLELTLAADVPKAQALETFLKESGVSVRDGPKPLGAGVAASFVANTEQGPVAGLISFVEHRGKTFQLLGLTETSAYAQYGSALAECFASFESVSDRAVLDVKLNRLSAQKLTENMRLADLARTHETLPLARLAILNQTSEDAELPKGAYAKWVSPAP